MTNRYAGLLGLLLWVAACDRAPTEPATDQPSAAPAEGEQVLTRVGEHAVTAAQVEAFARLRGQRELTPELRQWALQELIDLNLLAADAEARGLIDSSVNAEIDVQRLSLLANRAVAAVARAQPISEEELTAEYERQIAVTGRREYRLRHVLLPDRTQAQQVVARLAGGETFAALLADYAEQIGAANAGDLGWVNLAQVPASFAEPVKALTPGAYTINPIQSEYGWHVVLLVDHRDFEPPAFEAVKDGIRSTLSRQQMERYLASLRERAGVSPR